MIAFNKPSYTELERSYVTECMLTRDLVGDSYFTARCHEWFENHLGVDRVLLTPSCTASLEMAAMLAGIEPGDEVIMPSYTFVSTANAFVLRGAKIVFVDIRPDTMNIDEAVIEQAITPKTKAIVPVHYAGVACEMDAIMDIAERHSLFVIEDAAQGMMSKYKGRPLGTIGHIGAYSFHATKNYTSGGEGGLTILNDRCLIERAEILREKGTNRANFFRGMVDKYSWVDIGSSYLMNDLSAAYLYAQLERASDINCHRRKCWEYYHQKLKALELRGLIERPTIPDGCVHNAHMYYVKVKNLSTREGLMNYLKEKQVSTAFHYVPLHKTKAGVKYGKFEGEDIHTTNLSDRLLRLPLYYDLAMGDIDHITSEIIKFFESY
ncbi:TDP-4-oxo-6-deoxy-D-glucose aminotransferase [Vibrio tubiashii]|nr:TDP-4-oxo-6-deoxy-D-glucose aminotransferase [Vibrio tubiashii]